MPLNGKKLFGAGRIYATLNPLATATPIRFGLVQDQAITFKRGVKEIYGDSQLAADGNSGEMSVTGKVTAGTTNPRIFADLLFSESAGAISTAPTATLTKEANNEQGTVPASSTYIITVVNSATWTQDLGVFNNLTGARYARVASGPVAGSSYTVAAGVYTFAVGDASAVMSISYLYTGTSTAGESVTLYNQQMGKNGNFSAVMVFPWQPPGGGAIEQDLLTLNNCLLTDHEISTKMGDFGKPPSSFTAFCDSTMPAGVLGTWCSAEAA